MSFNFKKIKVLDKEVTEQYLLLYVILRIKLFRFTVSSCISFLFAELHETKLYWIPLYMSE